MNHPAFGVELLLIVKFCILQAIPLAMDQVGRDYPATVGALDLKTWGAKMIPAGAHQGKSFKEAYDAKKICNQYRNRSAASTQWVLSFMAFIKTADSADPVKTSQEGEWEVIKENTGAAVDPPGEQPKPCQINLEVPAGSHVSIVVTKK